MGRKVYVLAAVSAVYGGEKAQLLHMARIGALILMVLFLAAAAAEFFWLDIPGIFALESGMAARKRQRQLSGGAEDPHCGGREQFVIERDIMIVHTDERVDGW